MSNPICENPICEDDLFSQVVGEEVAELEVDPRDGEHGAVDEPRVPGQAGHHARHVLADHLERGDGGARI